MYVCIFLCIESLVSVCVCVYTLQAQKRLKEAEQKAYLDPAKSLEEKEKGNACFKGGLSL